MIQPETSRLRRRSFYEDTESDSETTPMNTDTGTFISIPDNSGNNSTDQESNPRALIVWWRLLKTYVRRQWQLFPRHLRTSWRSFCPYLDLAWGLVSFRRYRTIKHWGYATHWLSMTTLCLLFMQLILFWYFQEEFFDLQVRECVFQPGLLIGFPSAHVGVDPTMSHELYKVKNAASSPVDRVLARRFDRQHVVASTLNPMSEWTCVSLVAEEEVKATELSRLLPRSRIVDPVTAESLSTRLVWNVGTWTRTNPLIVSAASVPWTLSKQEIFQVGFPDIVMANSEFQLRQLQKLRTHLTEMGEETLRDHGGEDETSVADANKETKASSKVADFAVYLLRSMRKDIYQRKIRKQWDAVLHVAVLSETEIESDPHDPDPQFTKELLTLWLQHPTWPTLYVRFERSLPLCNSLLKWTQAFHNEKAQSADVQADPSRPQPTALPRNIDFTCDTQANSEDAVNLLKNQIGIHAFMAPKANALEYQDRVLDTLSAGAFAITYASPVMQEWVPSRDGILAGTFHVVDATEDNLLGGVDVHMSSSDVEKALQVALELDPVHLVTAGRNARAQYLKLRTHFMSAMAAFHLGICDHEETVQTDLAEKTTVGHRRERTVDMAPLRAFLY